MKIENIIDYAIQMGVPVEIEAEGWKVKITPEKPEPKKVEAKKPAPIDHGKICALYKAGRSMEWIADDVGCSAQTVANHLKKEGLRA